MPCIAPARYCLPKVVAIWNDDDDEASRAQRHHGVRQQLLGIENVFEHVVDDDGVGGGRRFAFKKIMNDIDTVLLTEPGQPARRLVANIRIRIISHDIAEFSPPTPDFDDSRARLQMQMNEAPYLMMATAEPPIERRYFAVVSGIQPRRGGVYKSAT